MRSFLNRSTRRRASLIDARGLLVAGLLAAVAGSASGQVETLDPRLVSSSSISGSEQSAIETFVRAHTSNLNADAFSDVRRSRTALLAPLGESNVTVSFRNAYAQAMWPSVEALLDSDEPTQRLTGMRLAGMLGTDDAAERLIDLLGSGDPGVRVFAAGRLGDTLGTVGPTAAAISPNATADVIAALGDAISNDEEPRVADAAVRALDRATNIRQGLLNNARSRAIEVLSASASERIAGLDRNLDAAGFSLRVCGAVRTAVSTNDSLTADAALAAIAIGADVLAVAIDTVDTEQPATDDQIGLVSAGEAVVYLARRQHANAINSRDTVEVTELATKLQGDNIPQRRKFRNDGIQLLQNLEREYGFDEGRFIQP